MRPPGVLLWLLAAALMLGGGHARAGGEIAVVMRTADDAHRETLAAIRDTLQTPLPGLQVNEIDISATAKARLAEASVIVSLGSHAAHVVADCQLSKPVIHSLLSESAWQSLPAHHYGAGRPSAILLDQPATRQVALLELALPDWRRVALLAGPQTGPTQRQLTTAAKAAQFEVREATVSSERELFPALQRVLREPAVLIVTPDSRIFNGYTVQNVLLTAYRHRSPVLGFSAAYVRAGALLGLYSTPAQIGQQTADMILRLLDGQSLPPTQVPQAFEVAVNTNVARSLGISLDSAQALTAALARQEAGGR
ncbi:MAG: hypothetical protein CVU19_10550 [Betaproteobacteria bacterium HGW-Betaproteobacteria-13]|jgi:ABC-type uncharacterized transport system substrate-binding protein|nr:MAG: hypothetical protein CVU25_01385 [Betaproteobacteria bacterium HGW-Betaproteobacteria-19]PKO80761.1 MAG: hypothetical protein CVU19_10550 [Betaproteobacteria bacterium HGW-Betaproteobacteria-13]